MTEEASDLTEPANTTGNHRRKPVTVRHIDRGVGRKFQNDRADRCTPVARDAA
jgi:hypothetical protein